MAEQVAALEGPERLLGSRVLDFELKAVIGSGGMSVVYRGQHRVTGQAVAIKILPPELAVHEELKARFVEEARVLARLEHPNIVHLNNFTESGGRLCLVMQYVEGVTFESKIGERGKLAVEEALRVGIEVCKALEYAHAQGVVHRDIKPSNILVRADGAVKVTDFGIAKMIGNTRLTSTGQTMGTVRYMSPEQVRGKAADARSDIYSLGVTLYEALCGKTPFDGDNHFEIMQRHLKTRPPALSKMGAPVPATVERALFTALEKDAQHRYADAGQFRLALEHVLPEVIQLPERGSAPTRSRRLAAGLLGMTVLLGAGIGAGYLGWRSRPSATETAAPTASSTGAGGTSGAARAPAAAKPATPPWPAPHALAGIALATDEPFPRDGVRVQATGARDAAALRDQYLAVLRTLQPFLVASNLPAARGLGARFVASPLNLVVVPQAVLDDPRLWPGVEVTPGHSYSNRYMPAAQTLFVNDSPGFEQHDLAYGVALHVLSPVRALSTDDCVTLAEKFEAYYNSRKHK
jgi:serine/threonine-protein kinase